MSTILLAYCRDNAAVAEQLAHRLGRLGIPFKHLTNQPGDPPGQFASQVRASDDPVLLILADNFLRSEACMASALWMFQTLVRQKRVLTVVTDGWRKNADSQVVEQVPTHFDRIVHAIQYMNYWQTAYLERSAGLAHAPATEKDEYEQKLDVVRSIANEIGELFSSLREAGYSTREALEADSYALFFQHFGLQDWHEQYRKLAELEELEMPPIPEQKEAHPVAETPAVPGPLVPTPTASDTRVVLQEDAMPAFNGIDKLIAETPEIEQGESHLPASEPDASQSMLERLIQEPIGAPETSAGEEVRQMAQDAWFWLEKGYVERGMELFRLAVEQHPQDKTLRYEYEQALARFDTPPPEVIEKTPVETPPAPPAPDQAQEAASYDQMGENALAKGDFLLAKYCWDRVTELQPQYPGAYRKLAMLTSDHLTEYKETAAHYLEEALTADPNDADLHFRLGVLLRDHLEQPETALQHFRDTVVLQPDHALAWLALAEATFENDNPVEAETFYRQAIQLNPALQTAGHDARFLPPAPEPVEQHAAPEAILQPVEIEKMAETEPEHQAELIVESQGEAVALPVAEIQPESEPVQAPEAVAPPARKNVAEPLTVLITGATSGIGRATAELFAREGHRLILTGRRADRLQDIQRHIEADYHGEVLLLPFDVRDPEAVRHNLENLPEEWQNVDVLLNNAGLAKGLSPIHEGNLDHWETMIDTNLKGLLYVTRCVARGMVRRRHGHIINIGSSAGKEVYANGNVYCATKFAVDALTRAIRLDLHSYNIRVSMVSPGHVEETEFAINRFDGDAEKARIYDNFQPLKASDVADAIYYIATRPPHVNIQDIWMFSTQQASATVVDRSGR